MRNNIVLSICLMSYNRRDSVCESVQKILQYEGDDIEVIVSDNASEDGTVEALKKINDKRLRIYQNEINVDMDGNHIRMFTYATGKYVMIMCDHDWVEAKDIHDFIATYKDCDYDVIMCTNNRKFFRKNVETLEGRVLILYYDWHPGVMIMGKQIIDKLADKVKNKDIKEYTREWKRDILKWQRVALCIYSKEWRQFRDIIRRPTPEKLIELGSVRGKTEQSDNATLDFLPEEMLQEFSKVIGNPYILSNDMEMYIRAVYRWVIHRALKGYYFKRKDPMILARYNWKPESSICWIKLAIKFYKDAILILKEKALYTRRRALDLALITVEEYIELWVKVINKVKKKFFPKPWLRL